MNGLAATVARIFTNEKLALANVAYKFEAAAEYFLPCLNQPASWRFFEAYHGLVVQITPHFIHLTAGKLVFLPS